MVTFLKKSSNLQNHNLKYFLSKKKKKKKKKKKSSNRSEIRIPFVYCCLVFSHNETHDFFILLIFLLNPYPKLIRTYCILNSKKLLLNRIFPGLDNDCKNTEERRFCGPIQRGSRFYKPAEYCNKHNVPFRHTYCSCYKDLCNK